MASDIRPAAKLSIFDRRNQRVSPAEDETRSQWLWDVRAALIPWILARALVAAGAIMAYASVDRLLGNTDLPSLRDGLMSWDGAFYRDIAELGYGGVREEALRFFPLHPILGRLLDPILPGRAAVALVVEANLMALVAGAQFHRLVRREFGVHVAGRAVWMFSLFPAAFVLVFGYSEPLFLVGCIGAFDAARRERWWQAAAFGLIAGASRPLGLVLAIPMAIEAARRLRGADWRGWVARIAAIVGPAVATAVYLLYVQIEFGDGLRPITMQSDFRGDFVDPVTRLIRGVGDLFGSETMGDGLHIPFAFLFVGLLVVVGRKLPASYTAFTAVMLFLSLAADNINSLERYGLNAFPLIIALALVSRDPRVERVILVGSGAALTMLTAMALLGAYVP